MEVNISSPKEWLRELAVELEPERLTTKVSEMLAAYGPKAEIPGFRRGRVPRHVVEKRLGPALESAAVEELVESAVEEALRDRPFKPAGAVRLDELEVTPEKKVKFLLRVEVIPEFPLKNYVGLKLRRAEPAGFEAEFEKRLGALLDRCSTFRPVLRPAGENDYVSCDYRMSHEAGPVGEPRSNVMLQIGNPANFTEVNAALLGARPGDAKAADVAFPDDHPDPALAGRVIRFDFTVHEVKEKEVPELNEELARDLGFADLDALRQEINDEVLADRARAAATALKSQVFAHLVKEYEFEPPETWVKASFERIAGDFPPTDDKEIRAKMFALAVARARFEAVTQRIADEEKLEVTDEEIRTRVEEFARSSGKPVEEIAEALSDPDYRRRMLSEKVLTFIVEKADVI